MRDNSLSQTFSIDETLKGIILSGSPFSVNDENAPVVDIQAFIQKLPVLGVCYGAQLTAKEFGGKVEKSNKREYGRAQISKLVKDDPLLKDVSMSFAGLDEPWRFNFRIA